MRGQWLYAQDKQGTSTLPPTRPDRTRPHTQKEHLSSVARVLYRFEIALWTACKRLPTWKDKPARQVASRGGLKRTPPGAVAAAAPPAPAASDDAASSTVVDGNGGRLVRGGGGNEEGGGVSSSDARGNEGEGAGVVAVEMGSTGHAVEVAQEEEELKDALNMRRPAEVGLGSEQRWARDTAGVYRTYCFWGP